MMGGAVGKVDLYFSLHSSGVAQGKAQEQECGLEEGELLGAVKGGLVCDGTGHVSGVKIRKWWTRL